mgnify:CR=1 FL=1
MRRLDVAGKLRGPLNVKTARTATALSAQLRVDVNESYLLHGTAPATILSILSQGPTHRFSGTSTGTAFGDGLYFAEDAGKTDQYVTLDKGYEARNELHKRLYENARHEGKVFDLGPGRTGTDSLKLALEALGFGPTYHMKEALFEEAGGVGGVFGHRFVGLWGAVFKACVGHGIASMI